MNIKNLVELIRNTAENNPDQIATIWKTEAYEESFSYQEFWDLIQQFASGLEKLGVRPGTKVAILAHNHPYWLICDLAILSLGAVSVPINPHLSKQQILFLLDDVDIEMIIADNTEHYHLFNSLSTFHQYLIVLFDQEDKKTILSLLNQFVHLVKNKNQIWNINLFVSMILPLLYIH